MRTKVVVGVLVILAIAIALNMNIINDMLTTTIVVENVKAEVDVPVEVDTLKDALDKIKSRPDIQSKFDSYVKEVYLTEARAAKAKELEEAEAALDLHRTEHVSF